MITRVYVNAPGTDTAANSSVNGEYVTIKNTTRAGINLNRWTLRDASSHVYTFPNVALAAGRTITIHTGKARNTASALYENFGYHIWNNDGGDTATLKDNRGVRVDYCGWRGHVASYVNC